MTGITCYSSNRAHRRYLQNQESGSSRGWASILQNLTVYKIVRPASLGILNFAAACGRQNWEVFGLSSPILSPKQELLHSARRKHNTMQDLRWQEYRAVTSLTHAGPARTFGTRSQRHSAVQIRQEPQGRSARDCLDKTSSRDRYWAKQAAQQ